MMGEAVVLFALIVLAGFGVLTLLDSNRERTLWPQKPMMSLWRIVRRGASLMFRMTTGLFMTIVVLGVSYWGWNALQERRLERKVSSTHTWKERVIPFAGQTKATLKTRCSESKLYYTLTLEPDPKTNKTGQTDTWFTHMTQMPHLILQLEDSDGFRVMSIALKENGEIKTTDGRFTRVVDDDGKPTALEINTTTGCDKHVYARASEWTMTWRNK
jgi:hypothetical protein